MVVISLFDGVSCARVALERAGYSDIRYYASDSKTPVSVRNLGKTKGLRMEMGLLMNENAPVLFINGVDLIVANRNTKKLAELVEALKPRFIMKINKDLATAGFLDGDSYTMVCESTYVGGDRVKWIQEIFKDLLWR